MPTLAGVRDDLERYFEFERLGTGWRTEITAGATTFFTMAYIIFVNPAILSQAGMPGPAVMASTCLMAGLSSILMGAWARYPIAMAPGMGLNAYFAFAVVKGMGVPWQTALGAVFLSGAAFLLLTAAGIREQLVTSFPRPLYSAVAAGIGLFIAFIGFRNAGIIAADPATVVRLGKLSDPGVLLALTSLTATAGLLARGVRAALLIGILISTAIALATGGASWQPGGALPAALSATAFHLDIAGALRLGLAEIVFVFLFVDLFDNLGTLIALIRKPGLAAAGADGRIPRLGRILTVDSVATMAGAAAGTSTVVCYIESASGIVAGGRSGVTAITTGVLFLAALAAAPVAGAIPAAATAPALILVGAAMMTHLAEIEWTHPAEAIPAFLTLTLIPLTFSIANGIALGFLSYTLLQVIRGEGRRLPPFVWVLTILFAARFAYLGAE